MIDLDFPKEKNGDGNSRSVIFGAIWSSPRYETCSINTTFSRKYVKIPCFDGKYESLLNSLLKFQDYQGRFLKNYLNQQSFVADPPATLILLTVVMSVW